MLSLQSSAFREITARVLLRRGLRRCVRGGRVPRRCDCRRTTPTARRCERSVPTHPQGHSRPAPGSASTATTTSTASARPCSRSPACSGARRRRRLAPAEPLRGGLRAAGSDAREDSPTRATGSCSPSIAASPPSRRSPRRGGSGWRSSSRITTGRAKSFRTARRRHEAVVLPVPGALRDGRRRSSSSRCSRRRSARAPPRPRRARDHRRRRAARRREPRVRDRRAQAARPHAAARPPSAHALCAR